jgi:flagellar basal-body rod modification protein FlgD
MAIDTSTIVNSVTSATGTSPSTSSGVTFKSTTDTTTIANNFQTFLTLLTTQLKNQNPLDPLDTNQFTSQLVQFASVEQQMKMNTQLESLITLEKSSQSTSAMSYLGATATVDGSTTSLKNGAATWVLKADKTSSATVSIADSSGNVAYSGKFTLNAGQQSFQWDGKGSNGQTWPDGSYKMTITATDASGNPVNVSTQVTGTVDAVDLTTSPAGLTIGGNVYTADKIKSVVRAGSSS